jgi:hypothetical protein
MRHSTSTRTLLLIASSALVLAALACSAPTGQPTQAVVVEGATSQVQPAATHTPVVVTEAPTNPPDAPAATPPSAPTSAPAGKTLSAGIPTIYYVAYSIVVAPGWVDKHDSDPSGPHDMLSLTKGDYKLMIIQAGMDGGACFFGGAPTPTDAAHLWGEFATGVDITGPYVNFRRGTNDGLNYTICEKAGDAFNVVSTFGAITYTTPNPADPAVLAEMDGMLASITK